MIIIVGEGQPALHARDSILHLNAVRISDHSRRAESIKVQATELTPLK